MSSSLDVAQPDQARIVGLECTVLPQNWWSLRHLYQSQLVSLPRTIIEKSNIDA